MGVARLLQMAAAATAITLAMAAPGGPAPTLRTTLQTTYPTATVTCTNGPVATINNYPLQYMVNARPADANDSIISMDWIIRNSCGRFHHEPEPYPGFADEHCQFACLEHPGCVAYAVTSPGLCEYFSTLINSSALVPNAGVLPKKYRMYNARCDATTYGYGIPGGRRDDAPQPTGTNGGKCVDGIPADNGPLYPIFGYQDARPDLKSNYVLDRTWMMKHVIGDLGLSGGGDYVAMKCQYSCNAAPGCVAYGVDSRKDCKFFDAIIDPSFLIPVSGNDTSDYGNYNKLCPSPPPPPQQPDSVDEPPSTCQKGAPAVAPEEDPDHAITGYTNATTPADINSICWEIDADWIKDHQVGQQKFAMMVAGNGPYVAFICQTDCTNMEGCLAYSVSLDALVGCRFFNQLIDFTKLHPSDDMKNYGNYNKRCLATHPPGIQPPGFEAQN